MVLAVGVAVGDAPVVALSPVAAAHLYVDPPDAVKVAGVQAGLPDTDIVGRAAFGQNEKTVPSAGLVETPVVKVEEDAVAVKEELLIFRKSVDELEIPIVAVAPDMLPPLYQYCITPLASYNFICIQQRLVVPEEPNRFHLLNSTVNILLPADPVVMYLRVSPDPLRSSQKQDNIPVPTVVAFAAVLPLDTAAVNEGEVAPTPLFAKDNQPLEQIVTEL